ncbi:MAG TPA: hypothetical protein PK530_02860 [Anaerolineales bacterium]|nr:hypothetical protein [Anaerolineales bacterium]
MTAQNLTPSSRRSRRTPGRRTFPWYLLTGLLIGLSLGLVYAWLIAPTQYVDTSPASLQPEFQDQYRALIAAAYAANGDLARAQARLVLLNDPAIADTLAAQAQRALAAGADPQEVQALAQLAAVAEAPPASVPTAAPLTQFPTPTILPTETPVPLPTATLTPTATTTPTLTLIPTETESASQEITSTPSSETGTPNTPTPAIPTRTPSPTITLIPSNTPTPVPTALSPFILDQRALVCNPDILGPLLIVKTQDGDTGIPGIEIILNWADGEEHFFTGLKPELGLGYADFAMTPDVTYTLRLADGSQLITDLTAEQCTADNGETIWGSWELIFIQP